MRQRTDVLFEELSLSIIVAVAVGRREAGGPVADLGKHSLLVHNSKFIYIINDHPKGHPHITRPVHSGHANGRGAVGWVD